MIQNLLKSKESRLLESLTNELMENGFGIAQSINTHPSDRKSLFQIYDGNRNIGNIEIWKYKGNANAMVGVIDSPENIGKIKPVLERVNGYSGDDKPFVGSEYRYYHARV